MKKKEARSGQAWIMFTFQNITKYLFNLHSESTMDWNFFSPHQIHANSETQQI